MRKRNAEREPRKTGTGPAEPVHRKCKYCGGTHEETACVKRALNLPATASKEDVVKTFEKRFSRGDFSLRPGVKPEADEDYWNGTADFELNLQCRG